MYRKLTTIVALFAATASFVALTTATGSAGNAQQVPSRVADLFPQNSGIDRAINVLELKCSNEGRKDGGLPEGSLRRATAPGEENNFIPSGWSDPRKDQSRPRTLNGECFDSSSQR